MSQEHQAMDELTVEEAPTLNSIERPYVSRTKTVVGSILTTAYIAAFAIYVVAQRQAFIDMSSAEFGTFLAGIFAPLAFLWLVIGFFQQGEELRHSADALWLQGEELRNSVEQQRQLVAAQREQLAFERERLEADRHATWKQAQPEFVFTGGGYATSEKFTQMHLGVLNRGQTCRDFRLEIEGAVIRVPLFESGQQKEFAVDVPSDMPLGARGYIAQFKDVLGNSGKQKMALSAEQAGDRTVLMPFDF